MNILPIRDVSTDWNASTNITSKKPAAQNPAICARLGCIGISISAIIILFPFFQMKNLSHRHAALMASDISMTMNPYLKNCIKVILCPCFAEFSDTMTLAAAPIIVMLPPRHAPSERLHQSG